MNPLPVLRALWSRNPMTVGLLTALVALAVALGIAISAQERALRQGSARAADRFDLIVAAPGSQTDLLFSTVYLRPNAVTLLPGPVAQRVLSDPDAEFAAPIAFGDSHAGAPVVGTTADFVTHLSQGLAQGRNFTHLNEAVVGALVPVAIGEDISVQHGHGDDAAGGIDADQAEPDQSDPGHLQHDPSQADLSGAAADHAEVGDGHLHDDVRVVGRMRPTGTPWDRAVIVPVEYIWMAHAMGTGHALNDDRIGPPWQADLMPGLPAIVIKPASIAAAYGLRARYRDAQTTAFFPAETLVDLYSLMGSAARVMTMLSLAAQILVIAAILVGLLAVLDLQRKSFAVLRALGASAGYVFVTVWAYVGAMVVGGAALGLPLGWAASALASKLIAAHTGVAMQASLGPRELGMAGLLVLAGLVLALIPAIRIYRRSVVQGLRQG